MLLVITDIKIKPYVRMTKRGKYVDPQAKEYLASKAALQLKYRNQMSLSGFEIMPGQTPLFIDIEVVVPSSQGHSADVDNILKAIFDAGNEILYPDDRWIDKVHINRQIAPKGDPGGLVITINALEEMR